MPRPEHTHCVDYDQPGKRWARAVCGVLVYRADAVTTPTCGRCLQVLAYRDQLIEALTRAADEPDEERS